MLHLFQDQDSLSWFFVYCILWYTIVQKTFPIAIWAPNDIPLLISLNPQVSIVDQETN